MEPQDWHKKTTEKANDNINLVVEAKKYNKAELLFRIKHAFWAN